jgi:hypothetical protein
VDPLEPPAADVWALGHLTVGTSGIAGEGLFAGQDIAADDIVFRLGGRLVSTADLESLIREASAAGRYVDTITVFEDAHLVVPPGTIVHFANHSCDPSLWHDGAYEVRARRDIAAGEELTIDYGTNSGAPGFTMTCLCGAPNCRGWVTSEDWRLPDLQRRYGRHWVPALVDRIRGTGSASEGT